MEHCINYLLIPRKPMTQPGQKYCIVQYSQLMWYSHEAGRIN